MLCQLKGPISTRETPATPPPTLVWPIDPLPDFLADHTLTGTSHAERLREVVSRWVQWLGSLWGWHDRAAFALRYSAQHGQIGVWLLARPFTAADLEVLENEVAVLLRAHRLSDGRPLGLRQSDELLNSFLFPQMALVEVAQYETRSLWRMPPNTNTKEQYRTQFAWLPAREWQEPRVIYPWWAPGGPFLVPMESLLSQATPVTLTIYVQPTELQPQEWAWLGMMAREAQTKGEQNLQQVGAGAAMRIVDPSASLAGRLYMANLRRLSATPFLVTVHCAAADGREDAARSVAGTLQALVHEPPFDRPQQEDDRLPSGAALQVFRTDPASAESCAALRQYQGLRFPAPSQDQPLVRIPYLADARGAATVFRLPVSVRGGVPGIAVRQLSPDFHPGSRIVQRPADCLELGTYQAGGKAVVPLRDLTKHVLVTGFTGSGKTVTVLQILHQLWADHQVPFLVLESAKQEYRGFFGVPALREDLRVYTVGNELCAPFRLNPFELLPGVRVEAHLGRLQTCLEGAIPPVGPSASVISEALLRVYEAKGWSLTDVYPTTGEVRRTFPTLFDFVATVEQVLEDRGYEGEVRSNLRAALVGRFKPLLMGGKGRMFGAQRSSPAAAELLRRPTILELNDLNLDDKALVVMFLLTILREHRERNRSRGGELVHVTVVEEAHNVLENVASKGSGEGATSADTRFKAVEAFCQLLTEIRALGEGLIIADQSPEKLARDAIRNTNLQIAHQLRDSHDREAVASAMIMEKEQQDFLGKLRPGQAALFRTGLEKATFIQIDKYYPTGEDLAAHTAENVRSTNGRFRGAGFDPNLSDESVSKIMDRLCPTMPGTRAPCLPYSGCRLCQCPCRYRDSVFTESETSAFRDNRAEWHQRFCDEENVSKQQLRQITAHLVHTILERANLDAHDSNAAWCVLVHLWHQQFGRVVDQSMLLDEEVYRDFLEEYSRSCCSLA